MYLSDHDVLRLTPMEVMNRIEQVFLNLNLVKGLKKNCMVKVIVNGQVTTRIKNNQLGLISKLNPQQSGLMMKPLEYDTRVYYYRVLNRGLILELMPQHQFRRSAMARIPMEEALSLFSVPRFRCFTEEALRS